MSNKILVPNTLVLPPYTDGVADGSGITSVCVLKSTASSPNPVVIPDVTIRDPNTGKLIYGPEDIVTIIRKTANGATYKYTYTVKAYVQSYNFLRILGGLGNVVFSS